MINIYIMIFAALMLTTGALVVLRAMPPRHEEFPEMVVVTTGEEDK